METHLKELRISLGLSQTELARRAGVSRSLLSRVENGRVRGTREFLEACGKVLPLKPHETNVPKLPSRAGLRNIRTWLIRAFRARKSTHVQVLREAFKLARYNPLGRQLVEWLDDQKFPSAVWTGIKLFAQRMNGPEQMLLLHGLQQPGVVQNAHPHDTNFPLPVVQSPGEHSLALIVKGWIFFAQVTVALRYSQPRMDYLLAIPGAVNVYINVELDGPTHKDRREEDDRRARDIGLPVIRFSVEELQEENFWETLASRVSEILQAKGLKWSERLGRTVKL